MRSPRSALVLGLALGLIPCASFHAASSAMDDGDSPAPAPAVPQDEPPPPPRKSEPETRTETALPSQDAAALAASDKRAREILAYAAARQNAGDLVEPGRLESFHVVFHSA